MRDQSKPDYRPAWLKACDSLTKTVVVVEPEPVIYEKHPVGPYAHRVPRWWKKPSQRRTVPLTPRALKRATPFRNDMPALVKVLMANHRAAGRATPNADARRGGAS